MTASRSDTGIPVKGRNRSVRGELWNVFHVTKFTEIRGVTGSRVFSDEITGINRFDDENNNLFRLHLCERMVNKDETKDHYIYTEFIEKLVFEFPG